MAEVPCTMCLAQRFEVFGRVQQVFFRKHTEESANANALTGFVVNTKEGTVRGEIQACYLAEGAGKDAGKDPESAQEAQNTEDLAERRDVERRMAAFRSFLHRGSPQSRVDRVVLGDIREWVGEPDWPDFQVSRGGKDREKGNGESG
jgi:Acylphosphatase